MMQIKKCDFESEERKLRGICKGHGNVSKALIEKLKNAGYQLNCVGTTQKAAISSMEIKIMKVSNSFLKGEYLCVGTSSAKHGKGVRYYAWIKEIIN